MSSISRIGFDRMRAFARLGTAVILFLLLSFGGASAGFDEIGKVCTPSRPDICRYPALQPLAEAVDLAAARKQALLGPKVAQDLPIRPGRG